MQVRYLMFKTTRRSISYVPNCISSDKEQISKLVAFWTFCKESMKKASVSRTFWNWAAFCSGSQKNQFVNYLQSWKIYEPVLIVSVISNFISPRHFITVWFSWANENSLRKIPMPSDALFVTKPFSFNFRPIFIWHISQRVQKSTVGDACSISWKKIILKVVSTDYQTKNQKIVQAQLTRKENCIMTLFVFLCELIRAFLARMCCWLTRYVFFSLSNSKRYTSRLLFHPIPA